MIHKVLIWASRQYLKIPSRSSFIFGLFIFLYLLAAAVVFWQKGVIVSNDSLRYINYAQDITNGILYDEFNFWYISYALFLSMFTVFGDNLIYVVFAQYLITLFALISLYATSTLLWKDRLAALLTCILFILFIEPLMWNSYILTESLYVSCICFCFYFLTRVYLGKRNLWFLTMTAIVILFTFFLRPNGICLVGAITIVCAVSIISRIKSVWQKIGVAICVCVGLMLLVDKMLSNYGMIENYSKGEVIYAITTLEMRPEWQHLVLTPPIGIRKSDSDSPVVQVTTFFFQHPFYFIQLAMTKAFYLFMHIRPYWSTTHNIFSSVFLITCYITTLLLFIKRQVAPAIMLFGTLFILLQATSVCLTSEDWDGRFLMPMLPALFLSTGYKFSLWIRPNHRARRN